jgi:hypothetical protein
LSADDAEETLHLGASTRPNGVQPAAGAVPPFHVPSPPKRIDVATVL